MSKVRLFASILEGITKENNNMKIKMGKLSSNVTIIKDGVDLKKRFIDVFENHPLTYAWSDGVKKMIAIKLFDEVMKDASK
jgi:hypothetical protein